MCLHNHHTPSTWLHRTSGGIGWKSSQESTTPATVCLCSMIYSALSAGNPRVPLLQRMPARCYNPARPRSSSASSPRRAAHVPPAGTRYRATRPNGVFASTGGHPKRASQNPLQLLRRSLGCASQGNVGA